MVSIRLRVALAASALISASSLALADSSGPKTLNDSQMDFVTAGAQVSITTTGSALARGGLLASTISDTGTTASSNGTTAAASGHGVGIAFAPQGSRAADLSATVSADGPAYIFRMSIPIDTTMAAANFTVAGVLTPSPLPPR